MYSVQRINDIRGFAVYLIKRGPKTANANGVVWRGTNAHEAFMQLYRLASK